MFARCHHPGGAGSDRCHQLRDHRNRQFFGHAGAGAAKPALEVAREAVRLAPDRDRLHEIEALLLSVRALRALGERDIVDELEDLLVRAAELIDLTGAIYFQAELHFEAAEIADLRGDRAVAKREFGRSRRAFAERGALIQAKLAGARAG